MTDQSRSRVSQVVMPIMTDPRVRTGVVIAVTIAATLLVGVEIVADAIRVDQLESELGREITDTELEWMSDGWVPASIKAEL